MKSRCSIAVLKLGVLLLVAHPLLLTTAGLAADAKKLNVLFVVSDDMNNHLGCYGYSTVKSPNIDRLAQLGMRFDRAYCQVPICNPSRVSFLSGLRPDRTQVYTLAKETRAYLGDWVMLPEYFRDQGYYTAQVGKVYHTGDGHEDPRSWDFEQREFGKRPPESEIIHGNDPEGPVKHTSDWSVLKTADKDTPDGIVARKAAGLIEQATKEDKPFFMGVGFRRPHAPYAAPKKYFDMYPPDSVPLPPQAPSGHYKRLLHAALNYGPPPNPLTEQEERELIAAYYACNTFVDAQVGVLLETLDRLELWDTTIVVFFGDHGYHLGDHGGLWHKNSLFEESCRVPLVIYAPGMKGANQPCRRLVELIDLYPTLTALCGLPTPDGLDGIDLSPLLDDPQLPTKPAAYSAIPRTDDPAERVVDIGFLGRSVRTKNWRYTEWDNGKRGAELYDYRSDPHEYNNLAFQPEQASVVDRMRRLLQAERGED